METYTCKYLFVCGMSVVIKVLRTHCLTSKHILFQKIKFKSFDSSIVIIFSYFAVFLRLLIFKCCLVCLALKVCCARLLAKKHH